MLKYDLVGAQLVDTPKSFNLMVGDSPANLLLFPSL